MADGGKLCPYLHVPVQSGDDGVLERMRRKHTVTDFLEFVERVRSRVPGIGIGTDVMVGFPGEDERAFENTCRLVESVPFANVHVFSFSAREGTGAWAMSDRVPGGEIARRSKALHRIAERTKARVLRESKGQAPSRPLRRTAAERALRRVFGQLRQSGCRGRNGSLEPYGCRGRDGGSRAARE